MRRSGVILIRLVALAIGALTMDRCCILPFLCNRQVRVVQRRTQAAMDYAAVRAAVIARENIERMNRVIGGCSTDVNAQLLFAANAKLIGDTQGQFEHLDAALKIDQRPELYYDRGMASLALGRVDAAVKDLATAARFNPTLIEDLSGELRTRVEHAAHLQR
jgi:tetratricopeptide (TPR) repeat protein